MTADKLKISLLVPGEIPSFFFIYDCLNSELIDLERQANPPFGNLFVLSVCAHIHMCGNILMIRLLLVFHR